MTPTDDPANETPGRWIFRGANLVDGDAPARPDTTVIIDHAKGHPAGVEILARLFSETGKLYVCDVVTAEALSGGGAEERVSILRLLDALEYVAVFAAKIGVAQETQEHAAAE